MAGICPRRTLCQKEEEEVSNQSIFFLELVLKIDIYYNPFSETKVSMVLANVSMRIKKIALLHVT